MSFGKMRDIIHILEKDADVVDTNTKEDYIKCAKVRGYVKPTSGRKFYEAWAVNAEKLVTVIVRHTPVLKENCRLEFGGDRYRIESIVDIENRHKYMEIKCEALRDG